VVVCAPWNWDDGMGQGVDSMGQAVRDQIGCVIPPFRGEVTPQSCKLSAGKIKGEWANDLIRKFDLFPAHGV